MLIGHNYIFSIVIAMTEYKIHQFMFQAKHPHGVNFSRHTKL